VSSGSSQSAARAAVKITAQAMLAAARDYAAGEISRDDYLAVRLVAEYAEADLAEAQERAA
jgi:hypothetical protein